MEEPGGLQSIGSQRVGHKSVTNTYLLTAFAQPCSPHYNFTLLSVKIKNTGTKYSTITQEYSLDLDLQNALKFFSFRK